MTLEDLSRLETMHAEVHPAAPAEIYQWFPEMTKALREAWAERDITKAFHDVAVKERDYERVVNNRLRAALERIANPAAVGSAFHEEAVVIARRAL